MKTPVAGALAVLVVSGTSVAEVRLPRVISDHMVLQQQAKAPLWGWAGAGEKITVKGSWGETATVEANGKGQWKTTISTPKAGGPYTITFSGTNQVVVSDVLVGEVWICGGQSNMEWPVSAAEGAAEDIKQAVHPNIRLFTVEKNISLQPREDNQGTWAAVTPQTVANFSAVGYAFGKRLRTDLDVPVGLINCNWGGTRIEAWMSEGALGAFPQYTQAIASNRRARETKPEDYEKLLVDWWKKSDTIEPNPGPNWAKADFSDGAWPTHSVPGAWGGDLAKFDGMLYYRFEFEVPGTVSGEATLNLGSIDDRDEAYVNGELVGATRDNGNWQRVRAYRVRSGLLKTGKNVLGVKVLDTGGEGGLMASADAINLKIGERAVPLAGKWKFMRGPAMSSLGPIPDQPSQNPSNPTVLYNGMLSTVAPYAMRGAIWYQGEANRDNAVLYRDLFPAMIADWRQTFANPELAFGFVQLAPFTYGGDTGETSMVREAQLATLSQRNTGMAVTMDIGNPKDIHPRNKNEVGRRLSLWALSQVYQKDIGTYSGPIFSGVKFDGGQAVVSFAFADDGLMSRNGELTTFEVAGADRKFVPAKARIDGQIVIVQSDQVSAPAFVRYGWADAAEPNLFNKAGLPASPFRSDAPEGTYPKAAK